MDDLSDEILALMNGDTSGGNGSHRSKRGGGRQDGKSRKSDGASTSRAALSDLDQSDDDSDLDPSRVDEYGPDLMGDDEDRRRLARMTEFEREKTLHERAERRQQLLERLEVKRKLRTSGRRHADDNRRSSRVVPSRDEQSRGISELKRRREQKESHGWGDDDAYEDNDDSGDGFRSHRGDDGSGWGTSSPRHRQRTSSSQPSRTEERQEDQRAATLDELNSVRVTRNMLEKWAHTPFFEQAVVGGFIRMGIGPGADGQMVYRVCRVEGIELYHRAYTLGSTTTNLALKCSHGKALKLFRMEIISNGPFSQREFERYMNTLKHEKQPTVTISHVKRKQEDLEFARNYVLNDKEVDEIVNIKREMVVFNPTLEKSNMVREFNQAVAKGDHETYPLHGGQLTFFLSTATRYETEIAKLDQAKEEQVNERQRAMQQLNERNRRLNLMEIRKAEEDIRRQRRKEIMEHHQEQADLANRSDTTSAKPGSDKATPDANSNGTPLGQETLTPFELIMQTSKPLALDVDLDDLLT